MKKTIISLVAIAALAAGLQAQAPAAAPATAQKNQKNWKDQAEYALYSEIIKPTVPPAERLQNLDKWKAGYPQSDYAETRQKNLSDHVPGPEQASRGLRHGHRDSQDRTQ